MSLMRAVEEAICLQSLSFLRASGDLKLRAAGGVLAAVLRSWMPTTIAVKMKSE